MLNKEQINRIDKEIHRLTTEARERLNNTQGLRGGNLYIDARIESLKWAKENL
jgi:hypothetical protein